MSHENIRLSVNNEIKKILEETLREKIKADLDGSSKELLKLLDNSEFLPLLIGQEVQAGNEKRRVDIAFSELVFEIKSDESEFEEAYDKAKKIYLTKLPKAKYYILTTWKTWQIYSIERKDEAVELKREYKGAYDKAILKGVIEKIKEYRVVPTPENIEKLFTIEKENLLNEIRKTFDEVKEDSKVKPLYEAYKNIMKQLYRDATEEIVEDLFIRHTLMHMIVLSCLNSILKGGGTPEDYCSGSRLKVDVGLLYLNWWKIAGKSSKLKETLEKVTTRASLIDWEYGGVEDVFRQLYEVLVEPEVRRKIGEYYTPLWLVELTISEFSLKDKFVLDPFCGSGTFLVEAFHKKVMEGEEPSKAFHEVTGFDVNPLAIAVARAELIIAYMKYKQDEILPPHVYHTDSMRTFMGIEANKRMSSELRKKNLEMSDIDELRAEVNTIASALSSPLFFKSFEEEPSRIMKSLSFIEHAITTSISLAIIDCRLSNVECISKKTMLNLEERLSKNDSPFVEAFLEEMKERNIVEKLAKLVIKYQGNNVWSLVFSSFYVPATLRFVKPHIIVTNPPWIPTTEFNAPYREEVNEEARELLENIGIERRRAASIVVGGDVASIALHKALSIAKEGIGFIMSRKQSFYAEGSMPAGVLLTYAVLRDAFEKYGEIKLIDLDYDAFEHGIIPAVVVAKKSCSKIELFKARIKPKEGEKVRKDYRLEEVELSLEKLGISYDDYVEQSISYFRESSGIIAELLDVNNVIPMGLYIRGLFGGEKKEGKKKYAGIVLKEFAELGKDDVKIKLFNTDSLIEVPKKLLNKFGIERYKLIYIAQINPFYTKELPEIILSNHSEKELKEFLKSILDINRNLPNDEREKIATLIEEVKQGNTIYTLNKNSFYVLYRSKRIFSAYVCKPDSNTVLYSDVTAIECKSEEQAYYYSAVLNYLAYKVIKSERTFKRDLYGRPALAIVESGLSWKSVNEVMRSKVVKLSRKLSLNIEKIEYENQKIALKELARRQEFQEIEQTLDSIVTEEKLEKALDLVSGKTTKKA